MKLSYVVVLFLGVLMCSSCSVDPCANKEAFKKAMTDVIEKAKLTSEKSGNVDWSKLDEQFDKFMQVCYVSVKEEMTATERIDFYEDVIEFADYRDDKKYRLKQILEDADIKLEDELEELGEQGAEELEKFFKEELVPELENVLDDVFKEIENFGKELKKELEKLSEDN